MTIHAESHVLRELESHGLDAGDIQTLAYFLGRVDVAATELTASNNNDDYQDWFRKVQFKKQHIIDKIIENAIDNL